MAISEEYFWPHKNTHMIVDLLGFNGLMLLVYLLLLVIVHNNNRPQPQMGLFRSLRSRLLHSLLPFLKSASKAESIQVQHIN